MRLARGGGGGAGAHSWGACAVGDGGGRVALWRATPPRGGIGARALGLGAVSPARVRPWSPVVVVVGSSAAVLGPAARRAMPFALTRAPLRGRALPAVPRPLRACRPGPPPPPPCAQCRRARPSAPSPRAHCPAAAALRGARQSATLPPPSPPTASPPAECPSAPAPAALPNTSERPR